MSKENHPIQEAFEGWVVLLKAISAVVICSGGVHTALNSGTSFQDQVFYGLFGLLGTSLLVSIALALFLSLPYAILLGIPCGALVGSVLTLVGWPEWPQEWIPGAALGAYAGFAVAGLSAFIAIGFDIGWWPLSVYKRCLDSIARRIEEGARSFIASWKQGRARTHC